MSLLCAVFVRSFMLLFDVVIMFVCACYGLFDVCCFLFADDVVRCGSFVACCLSVSLFVVSCLFVVVVWLFDGVVV